jgi:hypothetical protein
MRINTTTGSTTILHTFSDFGRESGIDINGDKIYVTDGQGSANQMRQYNLTTGTESLLVSGLPANAYAPEFDSANNNTYFWGNNQFYKANLSNGTYSLVSSYSTSYDNFAIDPLGQYLFVRNGFTVQRITIADGSVVPFMSGLMSNSTSNDLAFAPTSSDDGMSLYVVDGNRILEVSGFVAADHDHAWNGSQNSDWDNVQNWTPNSLPENSSNVLVHPGQLFGAAAWPILNVDPTIHNLEIAAGSELTIPDGRSLTIDGDFVNNGSLSDTLTEQGTLTNITVERVDSDPPEASGDATNMATSRYWTISPTGNGYTATLTLPHDNLSDPKVCRWLDGAGAGAGWDCHRDSFDETTTMRNGRRPFSSKAPRTCPQFTAGQVLRHH